MIIGGISIDTLELTCVELTPYVTKETCVLISADFGCELEIIVSKTFGSNCRCILSILCDIECRQLSLGSYALVNDGNCRVFFGISYSSNKYTDDPLLVKNETNAQNEMRGKQSNLNLMIQQLRATTWIKLTKIQEPGQMASKMWGFIIPKISLNILSIIYEQFDYDLMLQDKNVETMFKDLVRELFEIAYAQCNSMIREYMNETDDDDVDRINFESIINHCKKKKKELIESTAHEYPEYLSLPFESYCFYHRFEYPAHVLLYQPIILAKRYNVACSNLNFLYGFYSRLLSLSGLSIKGGRIERSPTPFNQLLSSSDRLMKETQNKKFQSKFRKNCDNIKFDFTTSLSTRDTQFSKDLETEYTGAVSKSSDNRSFPSNSNYDYRTQNSYNIEEYDPDEGITFSKDSVFELNGNASHHSQVDQESLDSKRNSTPLDSSKHKSHPSHKFIDDMAIMSAQEFQKINSQTPLTRSSAPSLHDYYNLAGKYNTSDTLRRPLTTTGLELQLRNGHNLIVKEYQDLQNKLYDFQTKDRRSSLERKQKYAHLENQLWKYQRRLNIHNGKITHPKTGPHEDLLDHIEILTQNSPIDVLKCTTGRYRGVDILSSLDADKERLRKLNCASFVKGKSHSYDETLNKVIVRFPATMSVCSASHKSDHHSSDQDVEES